MQLKTITNTNNLTLDDIADIIDNHFESEINLLFVCNKQLAEFIYNYVMSEYDIDDKNIDKEDITVDNIEEYYVSLYFSNDEDDSVSFFVENAKGNNGEYKFNDIEDKCVDYYICFDMDEDIVFDKLVGENATWNWVQVDMSDYEEWDGCEEVVCDNCEECEIPPEICEEINLINEVAEIIENGDMCPVCLRNALYDLYVQGKNVGWDDYKDYMQECIDTSVSDE